MISWAQPLTGKKAKGEFYSFITNVLRETERGTVSRHLKTTRDKSFKMGQKVTEKMSYIYQYVLLCNVR